MSDQVHIPPTPTGEPTKYPDQLVMEILPEDVDAAGETLRSSDPDHPTRVLCQECVLGKAFQRAYPEIKIFWVMHCHITLDGRTHYAPGRVYEPTEVKRNAGDIKQEDMGPSTFMTQFTNVPSNKFSDEDIRRRLKALLPATMTFKPRGV